MADFNADNQKLDEALSAHFSDGEKHLSQAERTAWNRGAPVIGTYVGDGLGSQEITLGFRPSFGVVFAVGQNVLGVMGSTGNVQAFSAFVSSEGCSRGIELSDTGFVAVYEGTPIDRSVSLTNYADTVYGYLMFR